MTAAVSAGGGWALYSSQSQVARSAASQSGYPDAGNLVQFSRALYFPRHDRKTTHLAVHDISDQYAAATGSFPIGSTRHVLAVGGIPKPQSNGSDETTVAYDVNLSLRDEHAVAGTVRCRTPSIPADIDLTISNTEEEAAVLSTRSVYPTKIPLHVTYPITPSSTRIGTVKHPYFTFEVPNDDSKPTIFQWQIHPKEHGRLRYTLVRNPERSSSPDIQAVYYHLGLDDSFALSFSEGILLLPAGQSSVKEEVAVTSVLAMLWRLRELHRGKGKVGGKKENKLKRIFGKK